MFIPNNWQWLPRVDGAVADTDAFSFVKSPSRRHSNANICGKYEIGDVILSSIHNRKTMRLKEGRTREGRRLGAKSQKKSIGFGHFVLLI